jgi:membrane protease YdiL (CAAX protease family)
MPPIVSAGRGDAKLVRRIIAAFEVAAISGLPTQILIGLSLAVGGMQIFDATGSGISLEFLATLILVDTALMAILIRVFLSLSGETSKDVFIGMRPIRGEILRGLAIVPLALVAVTLVVVALRTTMPWLHNVKESPIEAYLRTPLDAAIFFVVAVLAGGVREELQRGFIIHRFGQHLGGLRVGLVLFSIAFGLFHFDQGFDVAIAIGLLGLFWGVLFIRRRSVVMSMVSHAGFNGTQVIWAVTARSLGL